jgi:hypothetical protein
VHKVRSRDEMTCSATCTFWELAAAISHTTLPQADRPAVSNAATISIRFRGVGSFERHQCFQIPGVRYLCKKPSLLPGRCSFTVPPHSDVSNRGGIRGSNCGNIPRLAGRPKRIDSWLPSTYQFVRPSDRLTTPARSSTYPSRFPLTTQSSARSCTDCDQP